MENEIEARPATVTLYGLVRDKHGVPRFDNIKGIPFPLWDMLSKEEQEEIISRGGYPGE